MRLRMNEKEVNVKQIIYEDFNNTDGIIFASMTEWWNGEGIDILIQRRHMNDIIEQLSLEDISMLKKMISDFGF